MSIDQTHRRLVLTYTPHDRLFPVERVFDGISEDDVVFVMAGLAGRRFGTQYSGPDLDELKQARRGQMAWYADRMIEALDEGGGWWLRRIPLRVRARIVQVLMDYLRDLTATWTSELIGMRSEVVRTHQQARALRLRPAPEPEPFIPCRCCDAAFRRADFLPEGWTADEDGMPRCPKHRVVSLVKEPVT